MAIRGGQLIQRNTQTGFIRLEGYSLQTGQAVAYSLKGYDLKVQATRHGVIVSGSLPNTNRQGVEYFIDILYRAVRHHEHLASFPEGTRQEILDEKILDAEEAARNIASTSENKTIN